MAVFSQHNVQCNPWAVGHIHTKKVLLGVLYCHIWWNSAVGKLLKNHLFLRTKQLAACTILPPMGRSRREFPEVCRTLTCVGYVCRIWLGSLEVCRSYYRKIVFFDLEVITTVMMMVMTMILQFLYMFVQTCILYVYWLLRVTSVRHFKRSCSDMLAFSDVWSPWLCTLLCSKKTWPRFWW